MQDRTVTQLDRKRYRVLCIDRNADLVGTITSTSAAAGSAALFGVSVAALLRIAALVGIRVVILLIIRIIVIVFRTLGDVERDRGIRHNLFTGIRALTEDLTSRCIVVLLAGVDRGEVERIQLSASSRDVLTDYIRQFNSLRTIADIQINGVTLLDFTAKLGADADDLILSTV